MQSIIYKCGHTIISCHFNFNFHVAVSFGTVNAHFIASLLSLPTTGYQHNLGTISKCLALDWFIGCAFSLIHNQFSEFEAHSSAKLKPWQQEYHRLLKITNWNNVAMFFHILILIIMYPLIIHCQFVFMNVCHVNYILALL